MSFLRTNGRAVGWLGVVTLAVGFAWGQTTHKKATTHGAAKRGAAKRGAAKHGTKTHSALQTHGAAKAQGRAHGTARGHGRIQPVATSQSRALRSAFVASAQLRPMAQQLVLTRSAAAYNGVLAYAASHPGDAAATANLALGHAYMLDRRYADAQGAFRQASLKSAALGDYADYLQAQAAVQGGQAQAAITLLTHFAERHPGSVFEANAPVLLATAYLAGNQAASAVQVLQPLQGTIAGNQTDVRLALGRAYQASGRSGEAAVLFRGIYLKNPLSPEAAQARAQLAAMDQPLSAAERKQHADAMFNAKQYAEARAEYSALQKDDTGLSKGDKDALEIYAAVCNLRLKRLAASDVERLPVTGDDSAALKLNLESELARNRGEEVQHDALVQQIEARYPQSRWLEEALYSGGNMHLLKHESVAAIEAYTQLVKHFPRSTYAPSSHWHAAWLSYRLRHMSDAARLMDEQIVNYPGGQEIPGALYWRGRLYEDVEHDFSQAVNYYQSLNAAYPGSYYAWLGRQRLAVLGTRASATPAPPLANVRPLDDPGLTDELPENDPHLIKARLLANAALNEYIRAEIQMSPSANEWGALAEAEIYQSFGEDTRALQAMKRSKIPFFSLRVDEVPAAYWHLVFPRPYWQQLTSDAQANGLDPYLVAALIRQESEFNAGAVSRANAYGLMQLLPSVGKSLAKQQGERHFSTAELLDPTTNLRLGTADLRKSIDRYSGQIEYALAAYNAGDTPVRNWMALNDYKDIPEWVESIPYTETREYVQGIVRNREMYRAIYGGK